MEKKLLSALFILTLFFLNPLEGFGQPDCVSSAPTVTITNTTGSASLCKDGTTTDNPITLNSNSISSAKSYQWEVQVGSGAWTEISGATNANLNYPSAALGRNSFRLKVTYCDNSQEPNGEKVASSTQSGIITVYEKKEGKITIAASNNNICPGETVIFSTSNPGNLGATPIFKWELTRNGSTSTISTAASFPYDLLESGDQIRLLVSSSAPCVDPVYSTNTLTFTEKAGTPATPAEFTTSEIEVCPGTSQTYTVPNDNTVTEYIWTKPSGWTGSSTTNSITLTAGQSGSGEITVIAKNSCGSSSARKI